MKTNSILSVIPKVRDKMMGWPLLKKPAYAAILAHGYSHLEPTKKWSYFGKSIFKVKVYDSKKKKALFKLLSTVEIEWQEDDYFFYSLDIFKSLHYSSLVMDNATIDYSLILDHSLNELLMNDGSTFTEKNNDVIYAMMNYLDRIEAILPQISNHKVKEACKMLISMKDKRAEHLEEALQRILFVNQIMWQTNHRLVGLGRLDCILEPFCSDDMSDEIILDLLMRFCKSLHKYFWFKSSALMGDTGQIIILGGIDEEGQLIDNRLTGLFIKCIEKLKLPDPKILLRVSDKTPDTTWENALDCMLSQTGSPLFANDDKIIPALMKFGYKEADAKAYVTSACWEPIAGNSFEQNNMYTIDFVKPLCDALIQEDPKQFTDVEELQNIYLKYLRMQLETVYQDIKDLKFSEDAFVSSMMKCCRMHKKDITQGGSDYSNIGLLSVGLANAVNGIISIDKKVFVEHRLSMEEYICHMKNNFEDDVFAKELTHQKVYFGQDDNRVMELVNLIVDFVGAFWREKSTKKGYHYKFGLSSPGYVDMARDVMASPDGRKQGQPYSVHISADKAVSPTELINFAGKINLPDNGFNGNVVDLFMNPALIRNNKDAFISLLKTGVMQGFFEMQMNIIDSKTLIEARKNPDKFPNLIVRVWGFSAYFHQLPEEYKDYLIERALLSELAG